MRTSDSRIRTRLSWLWVFVMLNMIMADVIGFLDADLLEQLLDGHAGGVEITPGFLLAAAALTEVPLAMVVLSQVLPGRASRWANLAAAVFTVAYVWGGGLLSAPHYLFVASIETVGCAAIAWLAWKAAPHDQPAARAEALAG